MYFHVYIVYRIYIRTYISWSLMLCVKCRSTVHCEYSLVKQHLDSVGQLNKAMYTAGSYPGERFINVLAILTTKKNINVSPVVAF